MYFNIIWITLVVLIFHFPLTFGISSSSIVCTQSLHSLHPKSFPARCCTQSLHSLHPKSAQSAPKIHSGPAAARKVCTVCTQNSFPARCCTQVCTQNSFPARCCTVCTQSLHSLHQDPKMKYQDNESNSADVGIHVIRLLELRSTRGVERATFQNSNRSRCRENPFHSSDINLIPNLFGISSWVWRQPIQMVKHSALCCSRETSLMTTKTALDRSITLWVPQRPGLEFIFGHVDALSANGPVKLQPLDSGLVWNIHYYITFSAATRWATFQYLNRSCYRDYMQAWP